MSITRESLINAFNATSGNSETDEIESYESWLENQLIRRINQIDNLIAEMKSLNGIIDSFGTTDPKYNEIIAVKNREAFLLHLVDTVWMEAHESEEVPGTEWAKEMISKAMLMNEYDWVQVIKPPPHLDKKPLTPEEAYSQREVKCFECGDLIDPKWIKDDTTIITCEKCVRKFLKKSI